MTKPDTRYSFSRKVAAFFALGLCFWVSLLSVIGIITEFEAQCYTRTQDQVRQDIFENDALFHAHQVLFSVLVNPADKPEDCSLVCRITDQEGNIILEENAVGPSVLVFSGVYGVEDGVTYYGSSMQGVSNGYLVEVSLDKGYASPDQYIWLGRLVDLFYGVRYWLFVLLVLNLGICLFCFIYLLRAVGHRPGQVSVSPCWSNSIPLELMALALFFILRVVFWGVVSGIPYFFGSGIFSFVMQMALLSACASALGMVLMLFLCDLVLRFKLGGWWRGFLCWQILHAVCRGLRALFVNLPLLWQTLLFLVFFAGIDFFAFLFAFARDSLFFWFLAWVVRSALLSILLLYFVLCLRRLQKAGQDMAQGDLGCQVDTTGMPASFAQHGRNLNSIARSTNLAVEQRLKSERLKTELITNVSHDIKTPLTSLINYSDLICKEPAGSEKIGEYAKVLHRQAGRLHRLLEDLLEASKASTGSLEVHLAPCHAEVLLAQAAGEYSQRLQECGLKLVIKKPSLRLEILADGRHMARIFDNLLGNVCKYAQPGTRVYLALTQEEAWAVFTLKNTSRYPLDLSADELMERFVRGDSSRSTEGSGLGLSIAQSLAELQGGKLSLSVDGDLFKAVLRMPLKAIAKEETVPAEDTFAEEASVEDTAAKLQKEEILPTGEPVAAADTITSDKDGAPLLPMLSAEEGQDAESDKTPADSGYKELFPDHTTHEEEQTAGSDEVPANNGYEELFPDHTPLEEEQPARTPKTPFDKN